MQRAMNMELFFRLLLAFAVVAISWLAFSPDPPTDSIEALGDKFQHIAAFVALAFCADMAFPKYRFLAWKLLPLIGYGAFIEVVQSLLPWREASLLDLSADLLGISVYWLARTPVRRLASV